MFQIKASLQKTVNTRSCLFLILSLMTQASFSQTASKAMYGLAVSCPNAVTGQEEVISLAHFIWKKETGNTYTSLATNLQDELSAREKTLETYYDLDSRVFRKKAPYILSIPLQGKIEWMSGISLPLAPFNELNVAPCELKTIFRTDELRLKRFGDLNIWNKLSPIDQLLALTFEFEVGGYLGKNLKNLTLMIGLLSDNFSRAKSIKERFLAWWYPMPWGPHTYFKLGDWYLSGCTSWHDENTPARCEYATLDKYSTNRPVTESLVEFHPSGALKKYYGRRSSHVLWNNKDIYFTCEQSDYSYSGYYEHFLSIELFENGQLKSCEKVYKYDAHLSSFAQADRAQLNEKNELTLSSMFRYIRTETKNIEQQPVFVTNVFINLIDSSYILTDGHGYKPTLEINKIYVAPLYVKYLEISTDGKFISGIVANKKSKETYLKKDFNTFISRGPNGEITEKIVAQKNHHLVRDIWEATNKRDSVHTFELDKRSPIKRLKTIKYLTPTCEVKLSASSISLAPRCTALIDVIKEVKNE